MTYSSPDKARACLPHYLMIGLLATGAHYITLLLLSFVLPLIVSTLFGALLGTIVSYHGNKRWTFVKRVDGSDARQWLRFGVTALFYNLGNLAVMVMLLNLFPRHPWLMQMITTGALTLIAFRINQHWTFRHEPINS